MAPFWLVSTIARTPPPTASPAPGRGVPAVQYRLRTAEQKAVVYAADPKPIAAAAEGEYAAAGWARPLIRILRGSIRRSGSLGVRHLVRNDLET